MCKQTILGLVYISPHRSRRSYFRAFTIVNRVLKFVKTSPPQRFWFRSVLQNLGVVLFSLLVIFTFALFIFFYFLLYFHFILRFLHLSLYSLLHLCLFLDKPYSVGPKFVRFVICTPVFDNYRFSKLVRNPVAVMVYFTVSIRDTFIATVYAV